MRKLLSKDFSSRSDLCNFVNTNKDIEIEAIVSSGNSDWVTLYYWCMI